MTRAIASDCHNASGRWAGPCVHDIGMKLVRCVASSAAAPRCRPPSAAHARSAWRVSAAAPSPAAAVGARSAHHRAWLRSARWAGRRSPAKRDHLVDDDLGAAPAGRPPCPPSVACGAGRDIHPCPLSAIGPRRTPPAARRPRSGSTPSPPAPRRSHPATPTGRHGERRHRLPALEHADLRRVAEVSDQFCSVQTACHNDCLLVQHHGCRVRAWVAPRPRTCTERLHLLISQLHDQRMDFVAEQRDQVPLRRGANRLNMVGSQMLVGVGQNGRALPFLAEQELDKAVPRDTLLSRLPRPSAPK